jgi:hypothetical protein
MKKFQMTKAEAEAHQRKHGFPSLLHVEQFVQRGMKANQALRREILGPDKMNQTEREFSFMLEAKKRLAEIEWWAFEAIKLKLADGAWYTPDFMSWGTDDNYGKVITFYEIKGGFIREAAMVRFKVARQRFRWADFQMWQKVDGRWTHIL